MNINTYYDNEALWKPERFLSNSAELQRFAASEQMIPDAIQSILDVGSGNGAFLRYLEDKSRTFYLTGLESSHIAVASKICNSVIYLGSGEHLPFHSKSFDLVTAMEVLEHLPYGVYQRCLTELERVATSHILVTVPYREKRVVTMCPYCGCGFDRNYHVRSFDMQALRTQFRDFELSSLRIVSQREYIIMPLLRWYRSIVHRTNRLFPPNALCPQCGFQKIEPAAKTKASHNAKPLVKWIPLYNRPLWFIGLYTRKEN